MSDPTDDELFLQTMKNLGIGRKGTTAPPDEDFDALMAQVNGVPAPGPAADTQASSTPAPASGPDLSGEDALFEQAMRGLDPGAAPEPEPEAPPTSSRRRPTARRSVVRMLKAGDLEPQASLDLHRKTRGPAKIAVRMFLAQAIRENLDVVLIISGRGLHSKDGSPILQHAVDEWLRKDFRDWIVDWFPAPPALGGEGAWVVLPRRSTMIDSTA